MAPGNKRNARKRKRRSSCKGKQVKFSETDISVPSSVTSVSAATTVYSETAVKDKPAVFENKILRYLAKLMNYLRATSSVTAPAPQQADVHKENANNSFERLHADTRNDILDENVVESMVLRPDECTSKSSHALEKGSSISNPKIPSSNKFGPRFTCTTSPKAYDIVCAAIEFGVASGIVSKKGESFWIVEENCVRPRRSRTPGYALREHLCADSLENVAAKPVCSYQAPSEVSSSQHLVSPMEKSVLNIIELNDRKSETNPAGSCPTDKIAQQTQNRETVKGTGSQNECRAKIRSTSRCRSMSRSRSRSRPRSFRVAAGRRSNSMLSSSSNGSGFSSVSQSPPRKKERKVRRRERRKQH